MLTDCINLNYRYIMWTNRGAGGFDRSTGGTGPVGYFAKTVASSLVGGGTASQTDTHGVGKFVTALTGGSAGPESHSASQDWDYRHGDFAAALASGCAGCGLAGATGPRL